jgi:hypothetical protein
MWLVHPITQVRSDGWHPSYIHQRYFVGRSLVMFTHLRVFSSKSVTFLCCQIPAANIFYLRVTPVNTRSITSVVTPQSSARLYKVNARKGQPPTWVGQCPMRSGTSSKFVGNRILLSGHRLWMSWTGWNWCRRRLRQRRSTSAVFPSPSPYFLEK